MLKRTKVVVLGDSLALPRNENGECVRWEETWPSLLNAFLGVDQYEVINSARRARSSSSLQNEIAETLDFITPEFIVLQIGIVDAAPRIFSKREKQILKLLPARIRHTIVSFRSKRRKKLTSRNPMAKVEVELPKFRMNVHKFLSESVQRGCLVIILPIVANERYMEMKSPGFFQNINQYNEVLKELSNSLKTFYCPLSINGSEYFCADGYHLSPSGNVKIAQSLKELISNVRKDS